MPDGILSFVFDNKTCLRRKINGNLSFLEYLSVPISYDENYVISLKYMIFNIKLCNIKIICNVYSNRIRRNRMLARGLD
jgi:hypothetical protein